jgi:NADH pyrophosphatase NudC (nudix superfamily)
MKDYETNELTTEQDVEISCIRWMTYHDAIQLIRPYQIEKKMALTHIYSQITTHNL